MRNTTPIDTRRARLTRAYDGGEEDRLGEVLGGRYKVEARLGDGPRAQVFRVRHTQIGKTLAAKILRPQFRSDLENTARFLREARLISRIEHPNVISIVDFGRTEAGDAYFVMEYLRGISLADRLAEQGPLEPCEAISFATRVCDALSVVHMEGAVHRDVSPHNLILTGSSVLKLIDFGVARVGGGTTKVGALLGSPDYMAPEQIRGGIVDARTDLYGLGVTLFEMLTGALPFSGGSLGATLERHLHAPVPASPVLREYPALSRVVHALLAKDRHSRPANAWEARQLLHLAADEVRAKPRPSVSSTKTPDHERRLAIVAAACTLGLLAGSLAAVMKPRASSALGAWIAEVPHIDKRSQGAEPPPAEPPPTESPPAESPPAESPPAEPPPVEPSRAVAPALVETLEPEGEPAVAKRRALPRPKRKRTRSPRQQEVREESQPVKTSDRASREWDLRDPFGRDS